MNTADILTQQLQFFIEELRFAGYNISIAQFIAAQDLILALAAQRKLPSEFARLKTLLAPILCHSPKEQAEFKQHFEKWISQFETTNDTQSPIVVLEPKLPKIKKGLWKWGITVFAIVFILFLLSITVYWAYITHGETAPKPVETTPVETTPPKTVPIETVPELAIAPAETTPPETAPIKAVPSESEITQAESTPSETTSVEPAPPETISRVLWDIFLSKWQILAILLSPLLVLWWRYRAQRFLTRKMAATPPDDITQLFVKGVEDKLFQSIHLSRTAQQLRIHISMPANLLDIAATIEKTIQVGWFTSVTGTIKIRPKYLVLIDRTTFDDHQAELINSLINQLVVEDVLVTRYYFDSEPRVCYSAQNHLAQITLAELAKCYPEYRLMIFSDGNGFINSITGEIVNWIEQFSVWTPRVLFTLETPDQWGYRERLLAEKADFLIMPANEAGLTVLAKQINAGIWLPYPKPPSFSKAFSKAYPAYLYERPHRWLERHAPNATVLTKLLKQVRDFLGEVGYYWFSACAVYPELRWQLTLYLGYSLNSAASDKVLTEVRLAKLARLPWFRHGYMPNWLRKQLVVDLPLLKERDIRTVLQALLLTASSEKPLPRFDLKIAKNTLATVAQQNVSDSRPLTDYVFLTFMDNNLAVRIPQKLYPLLAKRVKQQSLQLRSLALAAVNLAVRVPQKLYLFVNPQTIQLRTLALVAVFFVTIAVTHVQLRENVSWVIEHIAPLPIEIAEIDRAAMVQKWAENALNAGQWDKAERWLDRLSQLNPDAPILAELQKHLQVGRTESEVATLLRQCKALLNQSKPSQATTCYQQVLERDNGNVLAQKGLEAVESYYQKQVKSLLAANDLTVGQMEIAQQHLKHWRNLNSESFTQSKLEQQWLLKRQAMEAKYKQRVTSAIRAEQYDTAHQYLDELRRLNPELPILSTLEEELLIARQKSEAERQLMAQLQRCQLFMDNSWLTTDSEDKASENTALVCYNAVLEKRPDNVEAKKGLQAIEKRYQKWVAKLLEGNQLDKASTYLERVRRVNPESEIFKEIDSNYQAKVETALTNGQPSDALPLLETLSKLNQASSVLPELKQRVSELEKTELRYQNLVENALNTGKLTEARENLQWWCEVNPNSQVLLELQKRLAILEQETKPTSLLDHEPFEHPMLLTPNSEFERPMLPAPSDNGGIFDDEEFGTFIAYATSPNRVASEGEGRNSIYTKHLLKLIRKNPEVRIEDFFIEIRKSIVQETGGTQVPWYQSSMRKPLYGLAGKKDEKLRRIALVIGNANYESHPLSKPISDATDMANALKNLGFDVTVEINATQQSMEDAVRDFGKLLHEDGGEERTVGLFYYSGHGARLDGKDYLIPINNNEMRNEIDVKDQSFSVDNVLETMKQASTTMNILILDAARSNPYPSPPTK
jgi:predicted Zn-dependent protease